MLSASCPAVAERVPRNVRSVSSTSQAAGPSRQPSRKGPTVPYGRPRSSNSHEADTRVLRGSKIIRARRSFGFSEVPATSLRRSFQLLQLLDSARVLRVQLQRLFVVL